MILTLRNIVRNTTKSNRTDIATAPTGCAAALIRGTTNHRRFGIPTNKNVLTAAPTNRTKGNSLQLQQAHCSMCRATALFKDEHSMIGTDVEAWLEHRARTLRSSSDTVYTASMDSVQAPNAASLPNVPSHLHGRLYGGPDFVYSFGDINQLPPVGSVPYYKTITAPPRT